MTVNTKRRIAECIGWLCLLLMLGVVGGCDLGTLPLKAMWWAFCLLTVGAAALYKAGVVRCRR